MNMEDTNPPSEAVYSLHEDNPKEVNSPINNDNNNGANADQNMIEKNNDINIEELGDSENLENDNNIRSLDNDVALDNDEHQRSETQGHYSKESENSISPKDLDDEGDVQILNYLPPYLRENETVPPRSPMSKSTPSQKCDLQTSVDALFEMNRKFKLSTVPTLLVSRTKRSSLELRWIIMILLIVILMGNFYAYDIPSPLHQQLEDLMHEGSASKASSFEIYFNMLFTVYSIPNIFLPFFGGRMVDLYGAPPCLLLFTTIVFLGQVVFTAGAAVQSWTLMWIGRFIFGLGGENINVGVSAMLSQWFSSSEIAFAFGFVRPFGRLGSVLNNIVSPMVANKASTLSSIMAGVIVTLIPVIVCYFLAPIDKEAQKRCWEENHATDTSTIIAASFSKGLDPPQVIFSQFDDDFKSKDDFALKEKIAKHNSFRSVSQKLRQPGQPEHSRVGSEGYVDEDDEKSNRILREASRFPMSFWLLCLICCTMYCCIIPFNSVASGILLERSYFKEQSEYCSLTYPDRCTAGYLEPSDGNASKISGDGSSCPSTNYAPLVPSSLYIVFSNPAWEKRSYVYSYMDVTDINCDDKFWSKACTQDYCSAEKAATELVGRVMSIPYIVGSLSAPVSGKVVGKYGRRALLLTVALGTIVIVHLTLAFTDFPPILPLILQGSGYGLFTAILWSAVPLTVDKDLVGTAYGVMTSIQNTGLAFFPLVVAGLHSLNGDRYIPSVEIFFSVMAFIGFISALMLNQIDSSTNGSLNSASVKDDEDEIELRRQSSYSTSNGNLHNEEESYHELT